ncbi:hypothetical protein NEAUS06_2322 [Nematocida ausubeli]|nr:hypothetical protein NEAUS06_2322 [Nematocida ausubeli]
MKLTEIYNRIWSTRARDGINKHAHASKNNRCSRSPRNDRMLIYNCILVVLATMKICCQMPIGLLMASHNIKIKMPEANPTQKCLAIDCSGPLNLIRGFLLSQPNVVAELEKKLALFEDIVSINAPATPVIGGGPSNNESMREYIRKYKRVYNILFPYKLLKASDSPDMSNNAYSDTPSDRSYLSTFIRYNDFKFPLLASLFCLAEGAGPYIKIISRNPERLSDHSEYSSAHLHNMLDVSFLYANNVQIAQFYGPNKMILCLNNMAPPFIYEVIDFFNNAAQYDQLDFDEVLRNSPSLDKSSLEAMRYMFSPQCLIQMFIYDHFKDLITLTAFYNEVNKIFVLIQRLYSNVNLGEARNIFKEVPGSAPFIELSPTEVGMGYPNIFSAIQTVFSFNEPIPFSCMKERWFNYLFNNFEALTNNMGHSTSLTQISKTLFVLFGCFLYNPEMNNMNAEIDSYTPFSRYNLLKDVFNRSTSAEIISGWAWRYNTCIREGGFSSIKKYGLFTILDVWFAFMNILGVDGRVCLNSFIDILQSEKIEIATYTDILGSWLQNTFNWSSVGCENRVLEVKISNVSREMKDDRYFDLFCTLSLKYSYNNVESQITLNICPDKTTIIIEPSKLPIKDKDKETLLTYINSYMNYDPNILNNLFRLYLNDIIFTDTKKLTFITNRQEDIMSA